jgi:hypothetical protein
MQVARVGIRLVASGVSVRDPLNSQRVLQLGPISRVMVGSGDGGEKRGASWRLGVEAGLQVCSAGGLGPVLGQLLLQLQDLLLSVEGGGPAYKGRGVLHLQAAAFIGGGRILRVSPVGPEQIGAGGGKVYH